MQRERRDKGEQGNERARKGFSEEFMAEASLGVLQDSAIARHSDEHETAHCHRAMANHESNPTLHAH